VITGWKEANNSIPSICTYRKVARKNRVYKTVQSSNVEVLDFEGMVADKVAPLLDVAAH
jgi:hypothetical protein